MTEEEKLIWKELENMGWSNEPKDMHLEYFKDIIKATKKALDISAVIYWVVIKEAKPINGREYLISDGLDVTEAQWYDDSKWGGEPYDSYTHYAEKPKPPCK